METLRHKIFGSGRVLSVDDKSVTVKFDKDGYVVSDGFVEIPAIGPGLSGYEEPEKEIPAIGPGLPGYEELEEEIPAIGPGLPGYEEPKEEIPAIGPGLSEYEEPKEKRDIFELLDLIKSRKNKMDR